MSKERSVITNEANADYRLRPIEEGDTEDLRQWKNSNKNSFFLRTDITPEQQAEWFASYSERPEDRMFVVEQRTDAGWEKIGCMGFRLLPDEGCVDAYNIIRSRKIEPASFAMGEPFMTMLAHAANVYPGEPIRCKVLTENPAVDWYERNGFRMIAQRDDHVLLELDRSKIEGIRAHAAGQI